MTRTWWLWCLTLTWLVNPACKGGDDDDSAAGDDDTTGVVCDDAEPVGLLDDAGLNPYPSIHRMAEDTSTTTGWRLFFDDDTLPTSDGGTPLDTARLNRLDGFSTVNTAVVLLADADIDAASLPSVHDLGSSMDAAASVQIIDLDSGERVPCFAELDAHPQCTGPGNRTLLIRPMRAMGFSTHHAVVITRALKQTDGDAVTAPERFAALRDGGEVHPGLCDSIDHYEALFADLEGVGIARQDLVLAWDFWTASEEVIHAPLDRIIEAGLESLPADPAHAAEYDVDWISDTDDGHHVNDHIWRVAQGSYQLPNYLQDDVAFALDSDALPEPQGDDGMYYMAMVPESLHDAPAGSAPVVIFGHGIFASPDDYIYDAEDPSSVCALADRLGMIFVGTKWRGLTTSDLVSALTVANDFGQFHVLSDKMVQGVANAVALPRLMQTDFTDASFFQAADGSGSLVDTSRVYYMGISLGGIEGVTLLANSEELDYGVFHVGGSMWSTMLERSSHWVTFDNYVTEVLPDPVDRQVLYSVSQLLWDPVDPMTHVHQLEPKSVLWQESMGDEQVPNMTTEAIVRTAGVPLLVPGVEPPYAVDTADAPMGPHASALMQLDPQMGRPDDENRPADNYGAHTFIRHTEEVHAQIEAFFADGEEGTIIHPCGDESCIF